METAELTMIDQPNLTDGSLVLGFTGWMDGGSVSTGTVEWLVDKLSAQPVAEIAPEGFYLYNLPGSMDVAAMFRPEIRIVDGIVESIQPPANTFHCDLKSNLVLFSGVEPNLRWELFAEGIFAFCKRTGVTTIYHVGSFAGTVPHTRAPRITSSVSDARLRPLLERYGVAMSNYEGPGSFASYMTATARRHGINMLSVVAEIPAYIQGPNPRAIETVVRKLLAMLGLQVGIDDLQSLSDAWEARVTEALAEKDKDELTEFIDKLEESYDKELFDTQLGDLKEWLEAKGIRLE